MKEFLRCQDTKRGHGAFYLGPLMHGSQNMIPLDDTLTLLEALLTISHMRSLAQAGSRPFFPPVRTRPTLRDGR